MYMYNVSNESQVDVSSAHCNPCVREIYEFISGKKEGVDREEEENLAKITQSLGRLQLKLIP